MPPLTSSSVRCDWIKLLTDGFSGALLPATRGVPSVVLAAVVAIVAIVLVAVATLDRSPPRKGLPPLLM